MRDTCLLLWKQDCSNHVVHLKLQVFFFLAMGEPFLFSMGLQIEGGDLRKPLCVPKTLVREERGSRYLHCSAVNNVVCKLFCGGVPRGKRLMSHTDVFEQLTAARNLKIDEFKRSFDPSEQLLVRFVGGDKYKRVTANMKQDAPSIVEIQAPSIGNVNGITMRVMMSWKKMHLYISSSTLRTSNIVGQLANGNLSMVRSNECHRSSVGSSAVQEICLSKRSRRLWDRGSILSTTFRTHKMNRFRQTDRTSPSRLPSLHLLHLRVLVQLSMQQSLNNVG